MVPHQKTLSSGKTCTIESNSLGYLARLRTAKRSCSSLRGCSAEVEAAVVVEVKTGPTQKRARTYCMNSESGDSLIRKDIQKNAALVVMARGEKKKVLSENEHRRMAGPARSEQ